VDQQRVVCFVKGDAEDVLHHVEGDRLLLGALHVHDMMRDAVSGEKRQILGVFVFLDKCPKSSQRF
jgi:hypothetical protein